jgi:hypothetical protein
MMKKCILLFFMVLPSIIYAKEELRLYPKIVVDKLIYNFGVIGQQTTVRHQFLIKNQGEADLHIHNIKPSCDCMAELTGDLIISVGSERILNVMFDTRKSLGMQSRSVEILSNDPETPLLKLEVVGKVAKDYAVIPGSLHFKNIVKGQSASKHLLLRQFSDVELNVQKIDASASWMSLSWVESKADKGITIKVAIDENAPVGRYMEVISIYFEQGVKQIIDVPILVNIIGGPIEGINRTSS